MGYYVETDSNKNKANWLIDNANGRLELGPFKPTQDRVGVCVVDNGLFEAAGIMFSAQEAEHFARPDGRSRVWLSITKDEAKKLCPHVSHVLK